MRNEKRFASIFAAGALAMSTSLSGCTLIRSEYRNLGGFTDVVLDKYWFKAETKQMRVLRSYSLISTMIKLNVRGASASERTLILASMNHALDKASAAFVCAYSDTCLFFDDLMADLDESLLKLAVYVLDKKDNDDLVAELQSRLVGEVPIVGDFTKAASKALDFSASTLKAVGRIGEIGSSILKIGWKGYDLNRRVGALYRDNLELDMVVTIDSLQLYCDHNWLRFPETGRVRSLACELAEDGRRKWVRGAGQLSTWSSWLTSANDAGEYIKHIVPQKKHFAAVTAQIERSCIDLLPADVGCPVGYMIYPSLTRPTDERNVIRTEKIKSLVATERDVATISPTTSSFWCSQKYTAAGPRTGSTSCPTVVRPTSTTGTEATTTPAAPQQPSVTPVAAPAPTPPKKTP